MKISYQNISQKEITQEQIIPNEGYYKVFKDGNDKIIKEEYYKDEKVFHTYFYVDLGSSHQEILDLQTEESIVFIEIEMINKNYFKHYLYEYRNGVLSNKDFSIYDNTGFCFMTRDIETNMSSRLETIKYYEDPKSGYEFEFNYSESGQLSGVIVFSSTDFFEPFRADELHMIPNFEWWEQYSSYYLNATPEIPDFVTDIK